MKEIEELLKELKKKVKPRKFDQISPAECLTFYPIVIQNAGEHLAICDLLAQNRKYGSAITHAILASEEVTKALILFLNGSGINLSNIKGFKSFFYKHTARHNLTNFILVLKMYLEPLKEVLSLDDLKNIDKSKISAVIDNHSETMENMTDDIMWWLSADSLKNKGLYVDYSNILISPTNLNENQFKECLKCVISYSAFCNHIISDISKMSSDEHVMLIRFSKTETFKTIIASVISYCAKTFETQN